MVPWIRRVSGLVKPDTSAEPGFCRLRTGTGLAAPLFMPDATSQAVQPLSQRTAKLAALEPSSFPVLSLYLNLLPDKTG